MNRDNRLCQPNDRDPNLYPSQSDKARASAADQFCFENGRKFAARAAANLTNIFRDQFPESRRPLVKRVLGAHYVNIEVARLSLDQTYRDRRLASFFDALAIAPYFGERLRLDAAGVNGFVARTPEQHFNRNTDPARGPVGLYRWLVGPYNGLKAHKDLLRSRSEYAHLQLFGYEGGASFTALPPTPGWDSDTSPLHEEFYAINRHSEMKNVYRQYLRMFSSVSGQGLFMHFSAGGKWSKYGTWAQRERADIPRAQAPKYDALREYLEGR